MTKVFHITCSSRRLNHSSAGTAGIFIVLLIMAVFMALPMVLIIGNAFKPSHELWAFPPKLFPTDWTLGNFGDMFTVLSDSLVPFLRYLYNTLFITAVGTAGSIIFGSMCAFVLSKRRFPGKKTMLRLVVLSR